MLDLSALQDLFQSEPPTYLNSKVQKKLQVDQWLISATLPEFNHLQGTHAALRPDQLFLFTRLILHDVPCHSTGGHRERRCQIHLSRTAASGEIAVLGADYNLIGTGRDTWPGIDAGSATGF